jgi:hypothetical protein
MLGAGAVRITGAYEAFGDVQRDGPSAREALACMLEVLHVNLKESAIDLEATVPRGLFGCPVVLRQPVARADRSLHSLIVCRHELGAQGHELFQCQPTDGAAF